MQTRPKVRDDGFMEVLVVLQLADPTSYPNLTRAAQNDIFRLEKKYFGSHSIAEVVIADATASLQLLSLQVFGAGVGSSGMRGSVVR